MARPQTGSEPLAARQALVQATYAVVLAGGRGTRLRQLTDSDAKPAVPFGGQLRIIDFTLSNCINSGLRRIDVLTQYKAQSLIRHIMHGWDFLDSTLGEFIDVVPAQQQLGAGWYCGTANAVYQNLQMLRDARPRLVLVLAGDHVYKMDYGRMLAEHAERDAEVSVASIEVPLAEASAAPIYWGAYIKGDTYGFEDAPFDVRTIAAFESDAGKRVSIVHWGEPWYWGAQGGYMPFRRDMAERVRQRGSIPMINWNSWDLGRGGALDQPDFRLSEIIAGRHDAFIRGWARDARAWGYPLFLRFDHEMNGDWFPWSERVNGNAAGEYARMWRHVKAIFDAEGATNVTWVWAPNVVFAAAIPLASLYPGDAAVDWTGVSGYNWGSNPAQPGAVWQSFAQVHRATYDALRALAPSKPIMIAETASTEIGGSKAAWITDALKAQLPTSFPQIRAVLWFNWNVPARQDPKPSGSMKSRFARATLTASWSAT